MSSREFTIEFIREPETDDGEERVYEVIGTVGAYRAARINCPVEDSYPEEGGEVEICSITMDGKIIDIDEFSAEEILEMENSLSDASADWEPDYDDAPDDD